MEAPAILKTPNQMVMCWLPKSLAEKKIREGGQLLQHKLAGFSKDMEPIYSYLVAYDLPRYIPKGSEKIIVE